MGGVKVKDIEARRWGPCCHLSGGGGDTGPQRLAPSLIPCEGSSGCPGQSLVLHGPGPPPGPSLPHMCAGHTHPGAHGLPSLSHSHAHTPYTPARLCRPRTSPWAGLRVAEDTHAHTHTHMHTHTNAFPWPAGRRAISEAAAPEAQCAPRGAQSDRKDPFPPKTLG